MLESTQSSQVAAHQEAGTFASLTRYHHLLPRFDLQDLLDGGQDPRVGSGRNGSDGGTVSTSSNSKSSSSSKLGATFLPVLVLLGVCLSVFIVLRRKCHRVYAPRTTPTLVAPERPIAALPDTWFAWVIPFFKTPDTVVLDTTLDGYFFLRYLKVLRNIALAGIVITWPILLPINATGGRGNTDLDTLTMGNVAASNKYFAHALVAWVFFGFVLYMIVRECIYFINLRQAYLSSPRFAQKLSSRTIMLTSVPDAYLSEPRLKQLYGESARRVWIPRTTKPLVNMVKEREQTAERLEKAEIMLIKKANAARSKKLKRERTNQAKHAPDEKRTIVVQAQAVTTRRSTVDGEEVDVLDSQAPNSRTAGAFVPSLTDTSSSQSSQRYLDIEPTHDTAITEVVTDIEGEEGPKERDSAAFLEGGEFGMTEQQLDEFLSITAKPNRKRTDQVPTDPRYQYPYGLSNEIPDLRGSVAAQYLPAEARPYHRPIGNFLRRVDTIRWTRKRLKELNLQIYKLRKSIRTGKLSSTSSLPAAFIEFDSQEAAQAAHQAVTHHRPLQMSTRLLGMKPDEIVWSSLRMSWWEKIIRRTLVLGLITAAVVFWSLPCAFIGLVSNISFLAGIPFLTWLLKLPTPILSFLEGFVPALALTLWMSLVPAMLRFLAIQAGVPSLILVEHFTQNCYFAFQVVQVFLITTITSAASGALTSILADPISAKDLLAQNLPKASNFYLSYILIQCLASGAFQLLHVFDLIRHHILNRISAVPRARWRVWKKLRIIHYGGVYPVFTNMGVIALAYACIAPLILVFAAVGMTFIHIVWKYNITYVFDHALDSKGLYYPRALTQLIIGLYLAEICLIGLFALNVAIGPLLLMVLFFLFSAVIHFSVRDAIKPLVANLPQTLAMEEQIQDEDKAALNLPSSPLGAANDYYDAEQAFGDEDDQIEEEVEEDSDDEGLHGPVTGTRAVEGASGVRSAITEWLKLSTKEKVDSQLDSSGVGERVPRLQSFFTFSPHDKPNFLSRWLHPEIYEDFIALRKLIPHHHDVNEDQGPDAAFLRNPQSGNRQAKTRSKQVGERAAEYMPPEMWMRKPTLWIPRDDAWVSRQEVDHTGKLVPISDEAAWLDEKGNVYVDMEEAPIDVPRMFL